MLWQPSPSLSSLCIGPFLYSQNGGGGGKGKMIRSNSQNECARKNESWRAQKRHGKRAEDQRVKWTDSSPLTYSVPVHKIHFLSSFCNYIFFVFCFAFLTLTLWFPLSSPANDVALYISFRITLSLSILIVILSS